MRAAYLHGKDRECGSREREGGKDVLLITWIRVWDPFALEKHAHPERVYEFFFFFNPRM